MTGAVFSDRYLLKHKINPVNPEYPVILSIIFDKVINEPGDML